MALIDIKTATSISDYEQAIKLVTDIYKKEGYIAKESSTSRISDYIQPTKSVTLLASRDTDLLGTISLVLYRPRTGLPMSAIYSEELKPYTKAPLVVAEICQFAVDKPQITQVATTEAIRLTPMVVSTSLLSAILLEAYKLSCDFLTFTINPKHRIFYERIGCELFGQEKSYASVNSAPALAYVLDLKALKTKVLNNSVQSGILVEIVNPLKNYFTPLGKN